MSLLTFIDPEVREVIKVLKTIEVKYIELMSTCREEAQVYGGPMPEELRALMGEVRSHSVSQCKTAERVATALRGLNRVTEAELVESAVNRVIANLNAC